MFPGTLDLRLPPDEDFIAAATPNPRREQQRLLAGDPGGIEALGTELTASGRDFTTAYEESTGAQQTLAGGFDADGAPVYSTAVHQRALPANFPELGELANRAGIRLADLAGHLRAAVTAADIAETDMTRALDVARAGWAVIVDQAIGGDGLVPVEAVPGLLADRATVMSRMQADADDAGRRIDRLRLDYEGELMVVRNAVAELGFVPAPHLAAQPVDPTATARDDGADDAERLAEALDEPAGPGTLAAIDAATARLRLLDEKLASGGQLDAVDRAYATSLLDTLGAERLGALGGAIEGALASTGVAGDPARTRYEEMLTPFGTTITGLASGTVFDPATGLDRAARYEDLPAAARALIETRPGVLDTVSGLRYPNDVSASGIGVANDPRNPGRDLMGAGVTGMPGYRTITDMLDQSRVDPSAELARKVIEGAVQVRQDLNVAEANARNELTTRGIGTEDQFAALADTVDASAAETALSYGARSVQGSSDALRDPDTLPALMGLNWHDGTGAAAVIAAGTQRDPALGGGTQAQSDAAIAVFQEAGRDPIGYLGRPSTGAEDPGLPGRMVAPVIDAVNDVGVGYLDSFARPDVDVTRSVDNFTDVLGRPLGWAPQLTLADRDGFLQFVSASGDARVEEFWTQAKLLNHSTVVDALAHGDNTQVDLALEHAGRLDGVVGAAVRAQDSLIEATAYAAAVNRDATLQARAEQGALNTLATAGKEALGSIPGIAAAKAVTSPVLSVLTELGKGVIGIETIPAPPPTGDATERTDEAIRADAIRAPLRQDVLLASALDAVGAFPTDGRPPILTADDYGPDGSPGPDGVIDPPTSNAQNQDDTSVAIARALEDWAAERGTNAPEEDHYTNASGPQALTGPDTSRQQDSAWNTGHDTLFYGPDPAGRTPFHSTGPP